MKTIGMIFLLLLAVVGGYATYVYIQLPNKSETQLLGSTLQFTVRKHKVTSNRISLVGNRAEYSVNSSLSNISSSLIDAIIAVEDHRFKNRGVSYMLARAAQAAVLCIPTALKTATLSQCSGNSTITQQLAKLLLVNNQRSLQRKFREILWAIKMERTMTRDEILELYLNRIPLGSGTYGVESASRRYFGKSAKHLTLSESAILAGSVRRPNINWIRNRPGSINRANIVLNAMHRHGFLQRPMTLPANVSLGPKGWQKAPRPYFGHFWSWLQKAVQRELKEQPAGLYKIYTTVNAEVHIYAKKSLSQVTKSLTLNDQSRPEGAVMVMRPSGEIMAMIGGAYDSDRSRFINRAVPINGLHCHPPSSVLKTVLYTAALEIGLEIDSLIDASPVSFKGPDGNPYSPTNINGKVYGKITVSRAYAESINTAAVRLLAEPVGYDSWLDVARRFGLPVESFRKELGLALGQPEVCLIDMMKVFGVVASGGLESKPNGLLMITSAHGKIIMSSNTRKPKRTFDKEVMQNIDLLGKRVVQSGGTGALAAKDINKIAVAGKTGTSNKYHDAWFLGYTENIVIGTWIGNDIPKTIPNNTGGKSSAIVFNKILKNLIEHTQLIDKE